MYKTTIGLTVAAALAVFGAQVVHARGFGGAHAGGGASAGGSHGSSYHGSSGSGAYHGSSQSSASHGSSQSSAYHGGSSSAETYHGADGATAVHGDEGTAAKGPEGNVYAHPDSSGSTYHAAGGATYAHGATGYSASAAHVALPTDAGYGMSAGRTGTAAYAGYRQTEAVSGGLTAHGTAVQAAFSAPGLYGQGWHAANPGAFAPAGWTAGRAWATTAWPAVGTSLGWGGVQPIAYNYGSNITYQDNQVYCGDQAVATAGEYYQQAAALAQSAPATDPNADWIPLGVFALVQKEQSDPHYVMQLAVNKSGALAGNYSDLLSGTNLPIQGSVDKKTQRVAWTIGNNKTTVGEAGLYNLTQDEAPVLIHIGKDKTQQWLLVRLKQPEQSGGEK